MPVRPASAPPIIVPTHGVGPETPTRAVDEATVASMIEEVQPPLREAEHYEAVLGKAGFVGRGVVDGRDVGLSKNGNGRSPSFRAEAGELLRVIVDPAKLSTRAKKVDLVWYMVSDGHETAQRITIAGGDRDMRSGALLVTPAEINVPDGARGIMRLKLETTDDSGKVTSSWGPHQDAVVMPKGGATLVFDDAWGVSKNGTVQGGEKLALAFDLDRLTRQLGARPERAVACVKFGSDPAIELPLLVDGSEVTFVPEVQVPYGAENVAIWFRGEGANGEVVHDSALDANYTFVVSLPADDADMHWKRAALLLPGLPKLTQDNFTGIGPSDGAYNCIAWSLGNRNQWVWPGTRMEDFDALYAAHGYTPASSVDAAALAPDPGVDKIVLFGHPAEGIRAFEATHAALLEAGTTKCTSKLGTEPLIRHADPRVVEGPSYGSIARVYVRPREDA